MTYRAPLREQQFVLRELAQIDALSALPGCEEIPELLEDVLAEAATFASDMLAPLDAPGDRAGCTFRDGAVTTPPGFADAYRRYVAGGWQALSIAPEHGGAGMPHVVDLATVELFQAANVSFSNGPLLNAAAVRALDIAASPALKKRFIPRLASGEWMGTMSLTEPQAGSDLGATRMSATPDADAFRLRGQKIFITYGEHDWTPNIVHLVLARLPDAPAGTKGISLFAVPKVLLNADGSPGERNDVACAGIEHKLGQRANPTCTMNYGERDGALGELIGAPHRGLETMFVMMNAVRIVVGVQGIALADRAYQQAAAHALERVQFGVPIVRHAGLRRLLFEMRARIEAMRALTYVTAAWLDWSERAEDEAVRAAYRPLVDLLIPVVKGWCSESAQTICGSALQVFGGMGFIEETGVAQPMRDVRVATIYEGTTQIQALDLVGRKLLRDGGAAFRILAARIAAEADALAATPGLAAAGESLRAALSALERAVDDVIAAGERDRRAADACGEPLLMLFGVVAGGWQLLRGGRIAAERIAGGAADAFLEAKVATARYYAGSVLPEAFALERVVCGGSAAALAGEDGLFVAERGPLLRGATV